MQLAYILLLRNPWRKSQSEIPQSESTERYPRPGTFPLIDRRSFIPYVVASHGRGRVGGRSGRLAFYEVTCYHGVDANRRRHSVWEAPSHISNRLLPVSLSGQSIFQPNGTIIHGRVLLSRFPESWQREVCHPLPTSSANLSSREQLLAPIIRRIIRSLRPIEQGGDFRPPRVTALSRKVHGPVPSRVST